MFQMFGIDELKALFTDYSWILCQVLFAGYMTVLAIMDIKWKQISLALLLSGLIFVAAGLFCSRNISIFLPAAGAAVGIVFIIISRVTEESFGYGDSILILIMGGFLGLWNILSLLITAFSMAALFSAFMLIRKKFHRKSTFPFVPFLTAAYIGGCLLEYIKKKSLRGSAVIEMSYIIPLFLGLFVLIMHTVFYFHDKAILNGAASETAVLGAQAERRAGTEYDLEEFFRERTDDKLIYMTEVTVEVRETGKEITVSAEAYKNFMGIEVSQKALIVKPEENIRLMR